MEVLGMNYYVGIDLGGTNTKIGILNIEGEIFKSTVIKTLSSDAVPSCIWRISVLLLTL